MPEALLERRLFMLHAPSCRSSDIGRMEQGWQQHWSAQQANTADLRCRLDGLHAVTASQAQEVTGRLQGMAAELEAQRSRLDAVEARQAQRAQQGPPCTSPAEGTAATAPGDCGNAALPPSAAAAAATPPSSGREASNPSGATVDHIMRRWEARGRVQWLASPWAHGPMGQHSTDRCLTSHLCNTTTWWSYCAKRNHHAEKPGQLCTATCPPNSG